MWETFGFSNELANGNDGGRIMLIGWKLGPIEYARLGGAWSSGNMGCKLLRWVGDALSC